MTEHSLARGTPPSPDSSAPRGSIGRPRSASSTATTAAVRRIYAISGVITAALLFAGLELARLIPLPSPAENSVQLALFLHRNRTGILWGTTIAMFGTAFLGPFYVMMSHQLRKIPGQRIAADCQLALGVLLILETILPLFAIQAAVFRDRTPAEVQLLSDFCWIPFVGLIETYVVAFLFTGIAILQDRRDNPTFPRWVGYGDLIVAVISIPAAAAAFVKTGPFAWNGIYSFWLVFVLGGIWAMIEAVVLWRLVDEEEDVELWPDSAQPAVI